LRQPASVNKSEKLAYVEEVIELLEMQRYAEALVGNVGEGLSLEQRKRLTIAVELASKPALLLFLDEPTSGLDAMAAWSIVRLLRKLADSGQAILCTIHQPSGELFSQFDRLLLLQKGGKTVFFGDIGVNSNKVLGHFESLSGRTCNASTNPAEFVLDVIASDPSSSKKMDWHKAFINSSLGQDLKSYLAPFQDGRRFLGNEAVEKKQSDAVTLPSQFQLYITRIFVHYWRSPQYVISKVMLNLIAGLFIGSSFWGQGTNPTITSLENKVFAIFMSLVVSSPLAQQLQPVFFKFRSLYEAREKPSKMYSWSIMVFSCLLVEVPFNLFGGCIFFIPWYFMVGFEKGKIGGILWGFFMLYQLFFATLAQALAAIAPNATLASILFSSLFSFVIMFCGVLQPTAQLPYFWRIWMHPLSPFTYIIEGTLGPVLGGKDIRCSANEFQTINPPAGQSCQAYLGAFSTSLESLTSFSNEQNGRGYFVQNDNGSCSFCQYRNGDEYLSDIGFSASNFGRDYGIVISYVAFNFFFCVGAYYVFQVASFSYHRKPKQKVKDEEINKMDGDSHDEKSHSFEDADWTVAMLGYGLDTTSAESSGVTGRKQSQSMPVSNPFGLSQIIP
jgi:ATP-binding cassette subfamily G (WHITE) protein 2 (SNQ2)